MKAIRTIQSLMNQLVKDSAPIVGGIVIFAIALIGPVAMMQLTGNKWFLCGYVLTALMFSSFEEKK